MSDARDPAATVPGAASAPRRTPLVGLVLTGGGARAAYQAGVLRAIADMGDFPALPFPIIAGTSAGAINGLALASDADAVFRVSAGRLWDTWRDITTDQVFRTDPVSLLSLGTRWVRDLSMGGLLGSSQVNHLLDTAPLRRLLHDKIRIERLRSHFDSRALHGVAVSATNYRTGTAVSFFDGAPSILPWARSTRIGVRASLTVEAVLASAAIPVFFPPVRLSGSRYGDGCIRLTAPLSPAIHMGAEKILAIGIRYQRPQDVTQRLNQTVYSDEVSLVDVTGVLLNAVFLDSLDSDLEALERLNRMIAGLTPEARARDSEHLREIPVLAIKPSQDLGSLASEHFHRFPRTLRHLLRGLGASDEKGWDLLSYLAFDGSYTSRLLELGHADAVAQRDRIRAFLEPRGAALPTA